MRNEKGSAIALVLLVLAVVSLVGAGLLLQTRSIRSLLRLRRTMTGLSGWPIALLLCVSSRNTGQRHRPIQRRPDRGLAEEHVFTRSAGAVFGNRGSRQGLIGQAIARAIIEGMIPIRRYWPAMNWRGRLSLQFWVAEGLGVRGAGTAMRTSGTVSNATIKYRRRGGLHGREKESEKLGSNSYEVLTL